MNTLTNPKTIESALSLIDLMRKRPKETAMFGDCDFYLTLLEDDYEHGGKSHLMIYNTMLVNFEYLHIVVNRFGGESVSWYASDEIKVIDYKMKSIDWIVNFIAGFCCYKPN